MILAKLSMSFLPSSMIETAPLSSRQRLVEVVYRLHDHVTGVPFNLSLDLVHITPCCIESSLGFERRFGTILRSQASHFPVGFETSG